MGKEIKYTMGVKPTSVKVKRYTKDRIILHCSRLKISQGNLIELCINIAEKVNFNNELPFENFRKFQREETNRIISFIKVQDKNLIQFEKNIHQLLNADSIYEYNEFIETIRLKLPKKMDEKIYRKEDSKVFYDWVMQMILDIKKEYESKNKR